MLLNQFPDSKRWKVAPSPPDGHCLLHSAVSSLNSQFPEESHPTVSTLASSIKEHTIKNADDYLAYGFDLTTLLDEMHLYVVERTCNTNFGDIVPFILTRIIHKNICVLDTNNLGFITLHTFDADPVASSTVFMQRKGDHYNGLVLRPLLTMPASEPSKMLPPPCLT